MDKYDYLKLMIENRDVWNDDTVEVYFDAHEEYFDIVDNEERHKIPDEVEVDMIINSFYNIDLYSYLVDSMVERVLYYMELSEENFKYCLDKMFENKKGYYMMVRLFHFIEVYHKSYIYDVIDRINKLEVEDKFYLYKLVEFNKLVRDPGIVSAVSTGIPYFLKGYVKISYDELYVYPDTSLCIDKRDYDVLSLIQGYRFYIDESMYIHFIWDEKREELIKILNIKNESINLIAEIKDYYLVENRGFYYIRHRDNLNEDVYDVSIGNSLEKVLENVNLFSWIK